MTAWVVRAGVLGERDQWALDNSMAGGGFDNFPDLTQATSRGSIRAIADQVMAGEDKFKIANFTGQMWALRNSIKPGDLIVLPLKTTKKLAFGLCTSGYEYLSGQPEDRRHAVQVDWKRADVPRSALKDDLLNTINGAMTIFSATRNSAEDRLRAVLKDGVDPGLAQPSSLPASSLTSDGVIDQIATDPTLAITVDAIRDQVRTHLTE